MNHSLLALFALPLALAIGCSSASSDDTSSSEDELRASAAACAKKSCGDPCTLCPPGGSSCVETAVLKECNSNGRCKAAKATCGGADAGTSSYAPCAGKGCGDTCSVCAPGDADCVETAVLKFCHSDGACSASAPACIPPPPPPAYDACGGKACGAACSICPPGDPSCFETLELKECDAAGACGGGSATCGAVDAGPAPYVPCAGKACGAACTVCDPADIGCVETAVLKQCNASGACSPTFAACK